TDPAPYRFNLKLNSEPNLSALVRFENPQPTPTTLLDPVMMHPRSQTFMEFSRFLDIQIGPNCVNQTVVHFAHLRYTQPVSGRGTFALDVPVECPPISK